MTGTGHADGDLDEHDLGLSHDLGTLRTLTWRGMSRRRALTFLGGAGVLALASCASTTVRSASGGSTTAPAGTTAASSATTAAAGGRGGGPGGPPPGGAGAPPGGGGPGGGPGGAGGGAGTQPADGTIPQETAGPYPGDGSNGPNALTRSGIVRRDITTSLGSGTKSSGVPLTVTLKIVKGVNGPAMAGAAVYVWHCDQQGRYSMYSPGVTNETFLRGVQETDAKGEVTFTTIFPGAYTGRWPHIHYEVYGSLAAAAAATPILSTSQLAMTAESCKPVYAVKGYEASIPNFAAITLATDNVFSDGADKETPTTTGDVTKGYVATLTVPVAV